MLSEIEEEFIDILASKSGCFKIMSSNFFRHTCGFFSRNASSLDKIDFVSNEKNVGGGFKVILDFSCPLLCVSDRIFVIQGEDNNDARRAVVVK
jgi:hypothetical protein